MDRQKALEIFDRVKGREFSGFKIESFIDNGKSAAVFRATAGDASAAIKIFDTDLINKFGGSTMMARLEREERLVGHNQPNLVRMLGSGIDDETGYHFLAMEYLQGRSIAECLEEIPEDRIAQIIQQIAGAARFLEKLSLAHRDIKPANISISPDFQTATLLDLGVLRPVGEAGLTDDGGPTLFVGTNQYASPEFALRKEEDTEEGWRAVTFYQLGAVLHDLIMRKPLFSEHLGVPARLAQAVQSEVVEIRSRAVPPWVVTLAQNCLVKSPETRLRLVNWDSFQPKSPRRDHGLELRERIRQRASAAATLLDERKRYSLSDDTADEALLRTARNILQELLRAVGHGDPPLGRRIVYEIGAPALVRCDIEPSERVGLPSGLTICLKPEVLDATSRVIRISADSRAAVMASDWCPDELAEVYEGRLDAQEIDQQIGLYVLTQVDAAQSSSANEGD